MYNLLQTEKEFGVRFVLKEINTFIQQGCIELIKSDNKKKISILNRCWW